MDDTQPNVPTDRIVHETVSQASPAPLALYVVSLYGLRRLDGHVLSGDVLMVRPRGTADHEFLSAILGCAPDDLFALLAQSGSWSVREISEIDGYRIQISRERYAS